ncbi:hypothetical protein [uncultured Tolumonas sp.]|uniref:hypothetical protein n=1 Tax=uncultured Tolumonas sp. TaxID=263765 RepID=UPI00292E3158|nr:hypothetical protein [uncultured Tolumonas sp.]
MKATNNTMARFINTCENVRFISSMTAAAASQNPTEKMINWVLAKVGGEVEDLDSLLNDIENIAPRSLPVDTLDSARQTLDSIGLLIHFAKQSPHISMQVLKRLSLQITVQIDSIISDIPDEVMEAAL